ncbi:MAG: arylesterase [Gemmatimonadales bacterium]|nr:MAG: arylesterase [Gemmatimonadales bacterium]
MEVTDCSSMTRFTPWSTARAWPPLLYSFSTPASSMRIRFPASPVFHLVVAFRFVIVAALAAFAAAACSPAPPDDGAAFSGGTDAERSDVEPRDATEGSGDAPLVLFLGTSLTEGLGLENPGSEAWPARVGALAREDGVELRVRNAGLSGETSAGARRRLDWVLDAPPHVFVLETGANDGLRGLSVEEMEANLDAIFGKVREVAPGARLVLAGMEAPPNLGAAYTEPFREVFPRVADRWDAELIPFLLEGVAGEPELNQADRIHPTAPGHERMAASAWPAIRRALEGG